MLPVPQDHESRKLNPSGSSSDQTDRGACRMEGFVLREDVPDRLGQLASEVDPGDLGAALAPEALLRALVSLEVARISCSVGGGFDQRVGVGNPDSITRRRRSTRG